MAFPGWLAVIEHTAAATIVTVVPVTMQTGNVVEARLTGRPELVAEIVNGVAPKETLPSALKVIAWVAWLIVKLRITGAAAA